MERKELLEELTRRTPSLATAANGFAAALVAFAFVAIIYHQGVAEGPILFIPGLVAIGWWARAMTLFFQWLSLRPLMRRIREEEIVEGEPMVGEASPGNS